jgi:hypothetical protein
VGGQVGHLEFGDGAEPGDLGIVGDGQGTVGGEPHVELDAVGPQPPGFDEGVNGVSVNPSVQPLCARRRSPAARHLEVTIPPWHAPKLSTKTPCQGSGRPLPSSSVNPLFTDGHHLGPIM